MSQKPIEEHEDTNLSENKVVPNIFQQIRLGKEEVIITEKRKSNIIKKLQESPTQEEMIEQSELTFNNDFKNSQNMVDAL